MIENDELKKKKRRKIEEKIEIARKSNTFARRISRRYRKKRKAMYKV